MKKTFGAIAVLSLAIASTGTASKPASAQVIINNFFSPFTTIQVGPGYRAYGAPTWWLHDPRHHQRCYRRWDPYFGEWQERCTRMGYWRERSHWEYREW